MAATIKINLVDNSKEWADALRSRFIDGGGAADEFEAHLAGLNRELESRVAQSAATQLQALADEYRNAGPAVSELADAERRLQAESTELNSQFNSLRGEIDAVSASVGEYQQAIEDAGESSERAGKSLDKASGSTVNEKLTGLCSNATQLTGAFQQIAEVCQAAYTVIAKFAETSPRFAELKDSLDGVDSSANTAVESLAATAYEAAEKASRDRLQLAEREEKARDQIKARNAERQKVNAAGLLASQSPRAVATQLGADRSRKATRTFGAKHWAEYQKSRKSSRELGFQIRAATDPAARKALMKSKSVHDKKMSDLQAGFQKEGRVARQQGFRDAVSGRAGTDEIAEAQQNLANNVINHGQGSGRLSQASAEALREATRVLLEQQAEQRAIAQDLDQTKQALQRMQGQSISKSRRQAGR